MNHRRSLTLFAIGFVVACLWLVPNETAAYWYYAASSVPEQCDEHSACFGPIILGDDPAKSELFTALECVIPSSSATYADVDATARQWNEVVGMYDKFRVDTRSCSYPVYTVAGDGNNDVAYVVGYDGDERLANVNRVYAVDDIGLAYITEVDVELDTSDPAERGRVECDHYGGMEPASLRHRVSHEWGHAVGLQHQGRWRLARMRTDDNTGAFLCGNNRAAPLPDDAMGGRALYSTGNSQVDIAPVGYGMARPFQQPWQTRILNNTGTWNPSTGTWTRLRCPEDAWIMSFTVANRGTEYVEYDRHYRLSENAFISSSDHSMGVQTNRAKSPGAKAGYYEGSYQVEVPQSVSYATTYFQGIHFAALTPSDTTPSNDYTYMADRIEILTSTECN